MAGHGVGCHAVSPFIVDIGQCLVEAYQYHIIIHLRVSVLDRDIQCHLVTSQPVFFSVVVVSLQVAHRYTDGKLALGAVADDDVLVDGHIRTFGITRHLEIPDPGLVGLELVFADT